ncbi:hypothetical protein [Mesorhizobium sp. KR1-2]|uniref:hypothetical protein n=1 Tax=Mesorhizobium sp. KR1-2 TaxID=3156609 RepID=UPI0032B356BD
MERSPQYICKLTEDQKLHVLDGLERAGSIGILARLLNGNFSDLATSASDNVRARYARWQEVARQGLAIEAEWGEGALLKLDDPVYADLRKKGLMNPDRIRNAEAYFVAHPILWEFNSPSRL